MKTPVLESLINKVADLKVCSIISKRLQHRVFLVNIAKSLRLTILKNICERLLMIATTTFLIQWVKNAFLYI